MNDIEFSTGIGAVEYTEKSLKDYYFKKRYQRYEPGVPLVAALDSIELPMKIAVLSAKQCPKCITAIPMLLRAYFECDNPKIEIRFFDADSDTLPDELKGIVAPHFKGYDVSFQPVFTITGDEAAHDLENALLHHLCLPQSL